MQFYPFSPIGAKQPISITYERIIEEMEKISAMGNTRIKRGRIYAVMNPHNGETFSPKDILRNIVGNQTFLGGKGPNGANRVFHAFGFPLGTLSSLETEWKKRQQRKFEILPTDQLLGKLFRRKWQLLPDAQEIAKLDDGLLPGVYMIGYSEDNLANSPVKDQDVFYIGMTCEAGLKSRLIQFRRGVISGGFHSGADRFYRVWLKKTSYNPNAKVKLYFAYLSFNCERRKAWRTPHDLTLMSRVPEVEYAAIARIKKAIGHEPLLNKK